MGVQSAFNWRGLLANALRLTFEGARDLYATFGYKRDVSYEDMLARYERQDVVSRIVGAYPDAVWVRPPEVVGNEALKTRLHEVATTVSLWHYINRVDKLAGIGKYAVMVLGFDDVSDTSGLAAPVRVGSARKLIWVQVYGYGNSKIVGYENNPTHPLFGMPKTYQIQMRKADNVGTGETMEVHRDRIIHVADSLLDNEILGYPILERVFNRLEDLEKVIGGASEMFFQSARMGLHIDIDKEVKFAEGDEEALEQEVEQYLNNVQRVLRTRGATVKNIGGQTINPGPVFNTIMSAISVCTGIPQRIFIGSEQGKLASEQDRTNWSIRINERRELFARPRILTPLVQRLQSFGVLPEGVVDWEWPDAFQMSPLERAQTAAQQARSAANIANAITKQPYLLSEAEGRKVISARGELQQRGSADVVE